MITIPTVFILGAGASLPYGYPLGEELRDYICDPSKSLLPMPRNTFDISSSDIDELRILFHKSSNPSIDQFLNRNQGYGELGKEIITNTIFKYERDSKFREKVPNGDWYKYLYRHMTETLNEPEDYLKFKDNRVSFITFNYDRSLENFLFESLRCSFTASTEEEIREQFKSIPIHHVYGRLPSLPFENNASNVPYGRDNKNVLNPMTINQYSKQIKIMYERQESEYEEMTELIKQANRIFFLGFGFAKENIERLKINEILSSNQLISGTAFGHTPNEKGRFSKTLVSKIENSNTKSLLRSSIKLVDCDCLQLLRDRL